MGVTGGDSQVLDLGHEAAMAVEPPSIPDTVALPPLPLIFRPHREQREALKPCKGVHELRPLVSAQTPLWTRKAPTKQGRLPNVSLLLENSLLLPCQPRTPPPRSRMSLTNWLHPAFQMQPFTHRAGLEPSLPLQSLSRLTNSQPAPPLPTLPTAWGI